MLGPHKPKIDGISFGFSFIKSVNNNNKLGFKNKKGENVGGPPDPDKKEGWG